MADADTATEPLPNVTLEEPREDRPSAGAVAEDGVEKGLNDTKTSTPGKSTPQEQQWPTTTPATAAEQHETLQPDQSETTQSPPSQAASQAVSTPALVSPPETQSPASIQDAGGSRSLQQSMRQRTDSQSTTATTMTGRSTIRSSMVFVVTALETIGASKDARKNKRLGDSVQRALSAIKNEGDPTQTNPELLFEPLSIATEASAVSVVTMALDCIGKLISYSYFSAPSESHDTTPQVPPLIDRAIDTICDCFQGEATPKDVQMQIIKSLLAAILNDKIIVHGAGLLKAVRQTYNIFLLSKDSPTQQIAQGTLTQIVGTVFERVKTRLASKAERLNSSMSSLGKVVEADNVAANEQDDVATAEQAEGEAPVPDASAAESDDRPATKDGQEKMTLQTFENMNSFDDKRINDNAPTTVTRVKKGRTLPRLASGHDIPTIHIQHEGSEISEEDEEDEVYTRDAFLVFRSMCKLSTKTLSRFDAVDLKSQGMRSKLLSLHIIHNVLSNHFAVFVSPHATIRSSNNSEPTSFTQATKQYLCLSLSRNGASSVNKVFEVGCEIFWLMLRYLRVMLKKELEVFLKEIYLAILHKRTAPAFQKQYIITVFGRVAADPRALVEIYLNYDCDRGALDNMYQRIIEHVSRIASTSVPITALQQQMYSESRSKAANGFSDWQLRGTMPPSLATASINGTADLDQGFPLEYAMKQQSLECLVETLRSMVNWSQQGIADATASFGEADTRRSADDLRDSDDIRETRDTGSLASTVAVSNFTQASETPGTPVAEDDPAELERVKQGKTALNAAIRQFNFKPKHGIKALLKDGFIASDSPQDIACFLLQNERIDKKALGEFLGEGDQENINIMHAFVDNMDFAKTRFVDALRRFLQSFRLPGEAQKIDRLMLKFAERYTTGNPNAFANADTAYVLAYSVIMLNTDQHSSNVKKRMTAEDFIKNNRGINDNENLPDEYLHGIFEEIAHNEIVLDTEREIAANLGMLPQSTGGLAANIGQALATVGRDLQREAYAQASEEMANKTEQLFKSLLRAQRRGVSRAPTTRFIPASSFKHVGPMFEVTWMAFLTAFSGQAQETNNLETIKLCMEGQKLAIRIACLFDLESPRQAFVGSLAKCTNLYNLSEMKAKNLEALKALLEVAQNEGNLLKESWRDILTTISQLDRFQLISTGVDEGAVPDMLRHVKGPPHGRRSMQAGSRPRPRSAVSGHVYQTDIMEESRSADMIRSVDRIFTSTANLSGDAIVHFVKALTQVSWQEIQSSGQSESPRTYSLQKLVEISGYNMTRVRFEWTNIWQVLGEHFIQVGCHSNTNVVYFALDSLRQLSMRFMEIEELPGFKFQKDFLKPFEHILSNANQVPVKQMVLECLIQMIRARGENIRSGWRTMFGVFTVAAREQNESIVNLAFDNVTQVYNTRFGVVISQGAFADLVICLTEFSKNMKFQKKSLQAIETLRSTIPKMIRTPECPLSARSTLAKDAPQAEGLPRQPTRQTQEEQYWFPVLFAFHDVLMTGEDLEVRSKALTYLFDTLTRYGGSFPREFWDTLWRQLLYPIFMVLKSKSEMSKALNHEELSVWLSTTMIQAIRSMINLFTHFFDSLEYMLDRFLDLLALCICQENDTLARIGSNCLQHLIMQNVRKFTPEHWNKIVSAFVDLFQRTEASALFSAATSASSSSSSSSLSSYRPETFSAVNGHRERRTSSTAPGTNGTEHLPLGDEAGPELSTEISGNALRINGLPDRPAALPFREDDNDRPTLSRMDTEVPEISSLSQTPGLQPELEDYRPTDERLQQPPIVVTAARRRFFNQIITKCVLQLLMIETVSELFSNADVYDAIPSPELLRLMALLKRSYHFARRFNADRELRMRLFREGFMKQQPNLLKQESGSASVYVSILLRMYHDTGAERTASRPQTEAALIPLCVDIISSYISLDEETQQRNIVTWRPVVVDVLEGYTGFPETEFSTHIKTFAPLAVGLMHREMGPELQRAVQGLWQRMCEVQLGLPARELLPSPMSPRGSMLGPRKGSRGR
ncbi:guanine nucleotide exchange protein for ADP-robosylation factor [Elasticomyces elasticus]|nr:guanine nucleotide exchange protein for ADP-robosylation factor [Elasticomyces elasticus]